MSLLILPAELMQQLSAYLSPKDIFALVLVSQKLYQLFIRPLYHDSLTYRTKPNTILTAGLCEITFWFDRDSARSVLEWTIARGHRRSFQQLLLVPGIDLYQFDSYGVTLLHRLSAQGLVQHIPWLLRSLRLAKLEPFCTDRSCLTPLHYAAGRNMKEAVSLLVAEGADVSAKDHHGNTPLHLAAVNGSCHVFSQLVRAGAAVTSKTRFGWTAIDQASVTHHQDAVEQLELLGSPPPTWQERSSALHEFVRLSPCPVECYEYHSVLL
jgi:hypothetical protein